MVDVADGETVRAVRVDTGGERRVKKAMLQVDLLQHSVVVSAVVVVLLHRRELTEWDNSRDSDFAAFGFRHENGVGL